MLSAAVAACGPSDADPQAEAQRDAGHDAWRNASVPGISNPSGDCLAPDLGSRIDHVISEQDGVTWLRDCRNPRSREYYRVFARSENEAYILPRPELTQRTTSPVCDLGHEHRALFVRYALCIEHDAGIVVPPPSMPAADALAIAHQLHAELRFEAVRLPTRFDSGVYEPIFPAPLVHDVLDACALHPQSSSPALQAACDEWRKHPTASSNEVPRSYGAVAGELATLLNELYGIR